MSNLATAVEIIARGMETGTVIDRVNRDYGQRLRIRNFEIAARHAFKNKQNPSQVKQTLRVLIESGLSGASV